MTQTTFPQILARMDGERMRAYRDNLSFYQGDQWRGRARNGERRLTFNYTKTVLEKITSYLMSGVNTAIEPSDSSQESVERARRSREALRRVHEDNQLPQPAPAQVVLGRVGRSDTGGTGPRAEPRSVAALHDRGAIGQPHCCAGRG